MIAIDTNLLVYAHRAGCPEHLAASAALQRAARSEGGWGIAAPCLSEFWAVVTGSRLSRPSAPAMAAAFIEALVEEGRLAVWQPGAGFHRRLLLAAVAQGVSGVRVVDLQIALCAREHGALELWTHDARFIGVAGLRVWDPLVG